MLSTNKYLLCILYIAFLCIGGVCYGAPKEFRKRRTDSSMRKYCIDDLTHVQPDSDLGGESGYEADGEPTKFRLLQRIWRNLIVRVRQIKNQITLLQVIFA